MSIIKETNVSEKVNCFSFHKRNAAIALLILGVAGVALLGLAKYGVLTSGLQAISPKTALAFTHTWSALTPNAQNAVLLNAGLLSISALAGGGYHLHLQRKLKKEEDSKPFLPPYHDTDQ